MNRNPQQLYFERSPQPMWVYERATLRFLAVNEATVALYGWSREEFLALTLYELRADDEEAVALRAALESPSAGMGAQGVWRHHTRAGAPLDVEITTYDIEFDGKDARLTFVTDVTARLRTEAALRASEARSRALVEQAAVGVVTAELDGTVRVANTRACDLLGYDLEELKGKSYEALTHPDDLVRDRSFACRLLAGEISSYSLEKRFVRKDGATFWGGWTVSLVRDAGGAPLEAVAVIQDISARHLAEELLRRRAERLAAIAEAQNEITAATLTLGTALPRLLARACAITNAGSAGIGRVVGDELVVDVTVGTPPFRLPLRQSFAGYALRTGQLQRSDDLLLEPDADHATARRFGNRSVVAMPLVYNGETHGVLNVTAPTPAAFSDEDTYAIHVCGGMLAAAMSHARELDRRLDTIAERTSALAAVRDREEQLAMVTDGIPSLVAYLDADQRYRFMNAAYERVLCRPRDSMMGKTQLEVLGPATYEQLRPWVDAALAGEQVDFDARFVLPDGTTRHAAITYVPRRDATGTVVGFFAISADLTEHDRLEERLRQALKMEAVGQLAGGVAHDFNNLLTVIATITHLLVDDPRLPDDAKADLGDVRHASERAADLTRKLLAFSRRQPLQPQALDLNDVVNGAADMLRRVLREDVHLVRLLAPSRCSVFADPTQIEQVVVNLVVNARDAMPDGGHIFIETETVAIDPRRAHAISGIAAGAYVRLTVRDTGHGMTPDIAAHAFEPFFTTKPHGQGTGLGLSTVYGIVQQSGGTTLLESTPAAGTSVTVLLPCRDQEPSARPETSSRAVVGGHETVLLVEDEEGVRRVARRVLETHGYRVLCARHGRDALELAASSEASIDLVLTDVVMPELSGADIAKLLKLHRPELPIVFMSGYATDELGDHGGVLPRDIVFLQKPFTPDALARAVRTALDRRHRVPDAA